MAGFNASSNYPAFKDAVEGIGEVGVILYWDDTGSTGQFHAFALVDGGRSCVVFQAGGLGSPPATFATDFPNATAISGTLSTF